MGQMATVGGEQWIKYSCHIVGHGCCMAEIGREKVALITWNSEVTLMHL